MTELRWPDPDDERPTANATVWHSHSPEQVLDRLASAPEGLSSVEAVRRLAIHGPNVLPANRKRSTLLRLILQFNDVLIYVLIAAAIVSGVLGHLLDTGVILLVVVANATIGFIQEGRAEESLEAIRHMVTPLATVSRGGERLAIPAKDIVPGDIVILEAGDRAPADLRLLRCKSLRMDEAILTGESLPVEKLTAEVPADAPLGDRRCMAYSGTLVLAGRGRGIAVATGAATQIGRIGILLREVDTLATPLIRQMNRFARQLTAVILVISAAVFVLAVAARGYTGAEAFMVVVGLAVAAIPEGLPAVMTITLAIGVQRMAARNAIIRRLPAVDTLGSVSIICSDKTGTLTRNEMMARTVVTSHHSFDVVGSGYEPHGAFRLEERDYDPAQHFTLLELTRAALLCNDASLVRSGAEWTVSGDPMEGALVSLAAKAGHDAALTRRKFRRIDELPFDAQHRFMATLHRDPRGAAFMCVKGAPETVLSMCNSQFNGLADEPLSHPYWSGQVHLLAGRGQRVLAVAVRVTDAAMTRLEPADVGSDLLLLGLIGLIDPPRDEAIEAVRECRSAGIQVKMITGDHVTTAAAIAGQLSLANVISVTTGPELDKLDDAQLPHIARATVVFARTSPEQRSPLHNSCSPTRRSCMLCLQPAPLP